MNGKIHELDAADHGAKLQIDADSDPAIAAMMHDLEHFRDVEKHWAPYHTPKNLAMALGVEASELSDIFTWTKDGYDIDDTQRAHAAEELADVMIYAFFMCSRLHLDPLKVIRAKHEINQGRHWQETEPNQGEKVDAKDKDK
ncbi:nucleotide pyrophosphohydrolase [Lacticaseibacillus zhaodongensis]|uniref:nucleotide pyrophosphohydrolase n=1 Tax=Lacticaseibacillus zhaodongensis TaxID=2668065 RepID=UPI0012D3542A|nr:nucleotide pyrophosphohydrolase [Lacticaseibacillus zhaodongensis]